MGMLSHPISKECPNIRTIKKLTILKRYLSGIKFNFQNACLFMTRILYIFNASLNPADLRIEHKKDVNGISNCHLLDYLFNSLSGLTPNKTKHTITSPLHAESRSDRWIPITKPPVMRKMFPCETIMKLQPGKLLITLFNKVYCISSRFRKQEVMMYEIAYLLSNHEIRVC